MHGMAWPNLRFTQVGMAMRLAFDLGLHLDMGPYVERGTIAPEDAEARRVTFWAAYTSEQYVVQEKSPKTITDCADSGDTTWAAQHGTQPMVSRCPSQKVMATVRFSH